MKCAHGKPRQALAVDHTVAIYRCGRRITAEREKKLNEQSGTVPRPGRALESEGPSYGRIGYDTFSPWSCGTVISTVPVDSFSGASEHWTVTV